MPAAATPINEKLDGICRRQQGRFMDHLEETKQSTPKLEADVRRLFGFIFSDVKQALQETCPEAENVYSSKR